MSVPAATAEFKFKRQPAQSAGTGTSVMISGSRVSNVLSTLYLNGAVAATVVTSDATGAVPTNKMCSFAEGTGAATATNFAAGTSKYEDWGGGTSDTIEASTYTALLAYQTAMGRP